MLNQVENLNFFKRSAFDTHSKVNKDNGEEEAFPMTYSLLVS